MRLKNAEVTLLYASVDDIRNRVYHLQPRGDSAFIPADLSPVIEPLIIRREFPDLKGDPFIVFTLSPTYHIQAHWGADDASPLKVNSIAVGILTTYEVEVVADER